MILQEPEKRLVVIQADREAFADLEEAFPPHMGGQVFRDGMADDHPGVQAFARHRTEALEEALTRAAMVADRRTRNHSAKLSQSYREAAHEIRDAIRSLTTPHNEKAG